MELKAYGPRGEVNSLGGTGHAGGFHHGEEEFELVDVHETFVLRIAASGPGRIARRTEK
jgi:hypothetical protein